MKRIHTLLVIMLGTMALTAGITQQMQSVVAKKNSGGSPPFSPSDIAGMQLWLAADGDVYNTGTTQATDGQTVETWVDASGGANNMTGAGGTAPTFQTSEINSLPVIRFDGSDDTLTSGLDVNQGFTVFSVAKKPGGGNFQILYGAEDIFGNPCQLWASYGTDMAIDAGSVVTVGAKTTGFEIVTAKFNSTSSAVYRNGGAATSASTSTYNLVNFMIADGATYPCGCDVAEIIIYNSVLGDTDREAVRDWLNAKYSVY